MGGGQGERGMDGWCEGIERGERKEGRRDRSECGDGWIDFSFDEGRKASRNIN